RPFLFQLNFRLIPGKEAAPGDESKIFLRFFRDIESDLSGFFRVRVYRLQEKPERLAAPVVDPWINLTIRFIFRALSVDQFGEGGIHRDFFLSGVFNFDVEYEILSRAGGVDFPERIFNTFLRFDTENLIGEISSLHLVADFGDFFFLLLAATDCRLVVGSLDRLVY